MAEAARLVEAAGADVVDINFGCPVRKVTKTGAGATLLEDPERACRIVSAVADAVSVPVTVKMRRGLQNGSRACLEVGPRLVEAGAQGLTLHPRSATQMYTGRADHSLDRRARRTRARARDRLRRHRLPRGRRVGPRAHWGGGGHGRAGGTGEPVGAGRDPGRPRGRRSQPPGGRGRAPVLHRRDGARARRAPGHGLPEEVLRLVSRSRPLPEAVQAGARAARDDRRGRAAAPGCRAPARSTWQIGSARNPTASTSCFCACRSRPSAAADGFSASPGGRRGAKRWCCPAGPYNRVHGGGCWRAADRDRALRGHRWLDGHR